MRTWYWWCSRARSCELNIACIKYVMISIENKLVEVEPVLYTVCDAVLHWYLHD
jgi:hypothetical protein